MGKANTNQHTKQSPPFVSGSEFTREAARAGGIRSGERRRAKAEISRKAVAVIIDELDSPRGPERLAAALVVLRGELP
jgi:hypothetical protein